MIDESGPWRDELRKSAIRLQRWNRQRRWTDRTYFLAERDIMLGAYSIRRLIDSGKSSSQLPNRTLATRRYKLIDQIPRSLDRFSPERFYALQRPQRWQLTVGRLCNQIIHSFIFQIQLEKVEETSLLFVSDRDRAKFLNELSFSSLADLFDYVGREDVIQSRRTVVDSEEEITNVSNHDVVERGHAYYLDDDCIHVDWYTEHQD